MHVKIIAVRGDSLGNNNLWREVNLLGELTFKVMATVEVSTLLLLEA